MTLIKKFPYWKVQYWEDRSYCWKDIQKAWHDIEDAEEAAKKSGKRRVRLLQVEGRGKQFPLPEIEAD